MAIAGKNPEGAPGGAGLGGGAPAPLRQAQLPLCGRGLAARGDCAQLLRGGPDALVMLPADRVAAVRAATARYHAAKARLEDQANAGLAELVADLAARPAR